MTIQAHGLTNAIRIIKRRTNFKCLLLITTNSTVNLGVWGDGIRRNETQ